MKVLGSNKENWENSVFVCCLRKKQFCQMIRFLACFSAKLKICQFEMRLMDINKHTASGAAPYNRFISS